MIKTLKVAYAKEVPNAAEVDKRYELEPVSVTKIQIKVKKMPASGTHIAVDDKNCGGRLMRRRFLML